MVDWRGKLGMSMPTHHVSDDLLLAYAAGTATEAESLLVASHLTLCPQCRNRVAELEAIGGSLLESAAPDPVDSSMLSAIMARIDNEDAVDRPGIAPVVTRPRESRFGSSDILLPRPLLSYLQTGLDDVPWCSVKRGIDQFPLAVGGSEARAKLIRIRAGVGVPAHTHGGTELTLVLSGGFQDERGHFLRGDVAVADEEIEHRPVADDDGDCLCLTVLDAPLRLTGTFGRFLNPFVRF